MMFRPPMRPNLPMGMRMQNMVPRLRMPPAPPPGLPNPRLMHPHKFNQQVTIQRALLPSSSPALAVFTKIYRIFERNDSIECNAFLFFFQHQNVLQQPPKDTKGMTTITAKPQIRNLSADVTRFVPSALRVKREDKKATQRPKPYAGEYRQETTQTKGTTKDDAYMQFMREMQGLL